MSEQEPTRTPEGVTSVIGVYGATGHTGRLVAEELAARGHSMILAGRDAPALQTMAAAMVPAVPARIASLNDSAALEALMREVSVVINCAGPFSRSGMPLASAAVAAGVHYVDHAAEPLYVEQIFSALSRAATESGSVVLPGMSFYGAVADLLAEVATEGMPRAQKVSVAYAIRGWRMTTASRETAMGLAGAERLTFVDGALQLVAGDQTITSFDFPAPIGRQPVLANYPAGEIVTIPRHVATDAVEAMMTVATFQEEATFSPDTNADDRARSEYDVVVDATYETGTRRVQLAGSDIYRVGSRIAVEAALRLANAESPARAGVLSASEAFVARDFLGSLDDLARFEMHPSAPTPAAPVVESPDVQVESAVEHCLEVAATWLRWDGRPLVSEDGDRVYTPHKAVRRIADHLVDHLAEIEALLAGVPTMPDEWHGSLVTLESDWARFTELDLDEARQRLRRLGRIFALRLDAAGATEWDVPRGENWSLRQIAEHVTSIRWYADQVGRL